MIGEEGKGWGAIVPVLFPETIQPGFDIRMIAAILALIYCAVLTPVADAASGPVFSPRILSPHVADAHSMRTFAGFHRWNDLAGDSRAYEIYKYLADTQTGLFHMNVVSEGLDQLGEFTQVRDPVKIINVYGYAYCGILGPTMAGICEGVSLGPSRMLTLRVGTTSRPRLSSTIAGTTLILMCGPLRKKTPDPFSQTCDLTRFVSGRYGYLLKIRLVGSPDEAVVRRLKITTWVQVAPASLPSLRKGINRMTYHTGDHYGQNTRVVELRSHASRPKELLKYLLTPPQDYDPARRTSKVIGEVTAKLSAPPGTRIAWFTATGQFRTHLRTAASRNRNSIAYSINGADDFQTIYQADVPTYTDHWHYNAAREVRLDQPATTLYVRYLGDPALNNFAIYAHCVDERHINPSAVKVTHVWRENRQRVSKTVTLDGPGEYLVETSSEPTNESIQIAVSSGRR